MQTLNIADLEAGNLSEPIWALNTSATSRVKKGGEVHIPIPKLNGSGQPDDLHLKLTWLPICITEKIPRNQLMQATELRTAFNNGLITFISAETAADINKTEGAEEERERLAEEERHVTEATAARSIQDSGAEIIAIDSLTQKQKEVEPETNDPNAVDASFAMFVNTLADKTDIEAMNLVRRRGALVRKEVIHLIKNAGEKPKLIAFLSKLI